MRIKDPGQATQIGRTIDRLFANSASPPARNRKRPRTSHGLASLGDVSFLTHAVIGAVLFMLLFLTGNTMMQSVRERIPEFGVLKTLGFSDGGVLALVIAEAVILCGLAGLAGLTLIHTAGGLLCQPSPRYCGRAFDDLAVFFRRAWACAC